MASGIFAVLDDITALMDDVALATKVATRKTAGILGDDLAVNAEKATGFLADREIPILWSITKGSLLNKLIIVPIALLLNTFFPVAITYILILGGCYLAFEGAEKIIEYLGTLRKGKPTAVTHSELAESGPDQEKEKVKSAIATDFILSVEIVIIALGSVSDKPTSVQIMTVSVVALLATVGVYGFVALIVRMDDAGYKLIKGSNNKGFLTTLGRGLVGALPLIIRLLGVVGTLALLLVAGGIFVHNIDYLHHLFPNIPSTIKEFGLGLVVGLVLAGLYTLIQTLRGVSAHPASDKKTESTAQ
jgi:predicted DNA repair protein MutK